MNQPGMRNSIVRYFLVTTFLALLTVEARAAESTWKAGTAKAVITPQQPMWMAGYASRNRPADGTLHELYVRVLAFKDAEGKRAVVVSTDLLGMSRSVSENVTNALNSKFGLSRDRVMLNASHTHSGPVLRSARADAYPLDQEQNQTDRNLLHAARDHDCEDGRRGARANDSGAGLARRRNDRFRGQSPQQP